MVQAGPFSGASINKQDSENHRWGTTIRSAVLKTAFTNPLRFNHNINLNKRGDRIEKLAGYSVTH